MRARFRRSKRSVDAATPHSTAEHRRAADLGQLCGDDREIAVPVVFERRRPSHGPQRRAEDEHPLVPERRILASSVIGAVRNAWPTWLGWGSTRAWTTTASAKGREA